jgi:branched-chain amino acid transport system permease protein
MHQVIAGLSTGGIYASVALALVMIYQTTHHINFAQGELAMFSTYLAWSLLAAGVPYWITFFLTILIAFTIGVLLERFIIRPLAATPTLGVVVVFIGLLTSFHSLAAWIFSSSLKTFPSPFPHQAVFAGHLISAHDIGAIGITLTVVVSLHIFIRSTSLGLALRAVAQDPFSSRLVGIRVNRLLALGWGLAAAIGAIAGMMAAPVVYLEPNMMSGILICAFAGALIGGITSPGGAVFGGFLVGVLENLLGTYVIGNELKLSVALFLIVGVLLLRPSGLFGRTSVPRV